MARPKKRATERCTKTTYQLDLSKPFQFRLMELSDVKDYFVQKMKIGSKSLANNPELLAINLQGERVIFTARAPMRKRYIKYIMKKYLHRAGLRDYIRVVTNPDAKNGFTCTLYK